MNFHITSQCQCQHRTVLQTSLSFWVLKYRAKLSWMNNNQFAWCGAKADRFPFNKSPTVETCFRLELKTRSDSACPWPAPAVAETCANCCARKKADRHLLLVHTVCTPLSGRGVWHLGDFATRRCVSESVSFSCSEESLICRCCSYWTEWTLQCCCRRYCYQRPETENRYKLLWLYVFHDVVG